VEEPSDRPDGGATESRRLQDGGSVKVRVRFTKVGKVRWTSHRDVARMWERACRRAGIGLAYTEGFSPRPKVSFGLALPTGHESLAEYLDLDVIEPDLDLVSLPGRLSPALPVGIDVVATAAVPPGADSLQHEVTSSTWVVEVGNHDGLAGRIQDVLAAPEIVVTRERKGRPVTDDIRPAIRSLVLENSLSFELLVQQRGVRPAELLAVLGIEFEDCLVRRTHQWIERDGARWEPISLDATNAPHAGMRAS
jgi:radical SAM-linked protein